MLESDEIEDIGTCTLKTMELLQLGRIKLPYCISMEGKYKSLT